MATKIVKWTDGKILKVGGAIAKDVACCCDGQTDCALEGCQCPDTGTDCYNGCLLFRVKTGDFTGCDSSCLDEVDDCATNNGMYGAGSYLEPTAGDCPCLWTDIGPDGLGSQACVCDANCDAPTTPVTPSLSLECVESEGACVIKATLQWDTATWERIDFIPSSTTWQEFTRVTSLDCNCNTPETMEVKAATCP